MSKTLEELNEELRNLNFDLYEFTKEEQQIYNKSMPNSKTEVEFNRYYDRYHFVIAEIMKICIKRAEVLKEIRSFN